MTLILRVMSWLMDPFFREPIMEGIDILTHRHAERMRVHQARTDADNASSARVTWTDPR